MHLMAFLGLALSIAPADSLQIRFVGNAGFELTDGVTTLLVDLPYRPGAFGYMDYDPTSLDPAGRAVSVITHRHADHFEPELFEPTASDIIGPTEVTDAFASERVLDGRIVYAGDFRIQRFRTPHRDTEHYSYLIEWRGQRLYFVGDTEDPSHLLSAEGLDLAFVTPWLTCAVEEAGRTVPAERVVLYHHTPSQQSPVCGQPDIIGQGEGFTIRPVQGEVIR